MQFGLQTMENRFNQSSGNIVLKAIIVIFLIAGLLTAWFLLGQKQIFKNQASGPEIKLLTIPQDTNLPSPVNIFITSPTAKNKMVVFVKAVIKFDSTQIRLIDNPKVGSDFKNVISISSADEANTTGQIVVIVGRDPQNSPDQSSSTLNLLQLNFEPQPGISLSTNGTTLSIGMNDSSAISLPENKQALSSFESKLSSDNTKSQEEGDLGLSLKISTDANGKKFLTASWNPISGQGFNSFTIAVRDAANQKLVPGSRETELTVTSNNFNNLGPLTPGSYYVNLRAKYDRKVVLQSPRKFFTISNTGKITVN